MGWQSFGGIKCIANTGRGKIIRKIGRRSGKKKNNGTVQNGRGRRGKKKYANRSFLAELGGIKVHSVISIKKVPVIISKVGDVILAHTHTQNRRLSIGCVLCAELPVRVCVCVCVCVCAPGG